MASASGKVEGAIADSSMTVLMEQQQEEVLPSGVCLFDHIDDLVPFFPRENALDFSGQEAQDGCLDPKDVEVSDPETTTISTNHHHVQLFEDIADFDWLSTLMDEPPFSLDFFPAQDVYFQTLSPVSVLEPNGVTTDASSSTCSSTTTAISSAPERSCTTRHDGNFEVSTISSGRRPISVVPGRARSKRSRPAALVSTVPLSTAGIKFKIIKKSSVDQSGSARKCRHCQIQKTPQWREGPMGPKTLCNACGVRYKSGRLFPEYRPAASPTFVSSRHSNSHKKVVEMRISNATTSCGCDLLDYIRVRPPTRED